MSAPLLSSAGMIDPQVIEVTFDQAMLVDQDYLDSGNYMITPPPPGVTSDVTVSAIGSTIVRLNLPTDLRSGGEYEIQVSGVQSKGGEAISDQASSLFIGLGNPPAFVSAQTLDTSTVRVEFSEPMDPESLIADHWSIVSSTTGKRLDISGVSLIDDGNGFFVKADLAISSKMTDQGDHAITSDGITDAAGNPQSTGDSVSFIGLADLPRMLAAEFDAADSKSLIVDFDSPMDRSFATAINSWRVESPGTLPRVYVGAVSLSEDRKSARLSVSESKQDSVYAAQASALVVDDYGNPLEVNFNYQVFRGRGEPPTLDRFSRVGPNRIDAHFSEPMLDGVEIRNPARYTFDNGATTIAVLAVEGAVIKLSVSNLQPETLYTLTIA